MQEQEDDGADCGICDAKLHDGTPISKDGKKHKRCAAAELCRQRELRKRPDLKLRMDELKMKDPSKAKLVTKALTTEKKGTRSQALRSQALQFVETLTAEIKVRAKREVVMLTKPEFVAYMMQTRGVSKVGANKLWKAIPLIGFLRMRFDFHAIRFALWFCLQT